MKVAGSKDHFFSAASSLRPLCLISAAMMSWICCLLTDSERFILFAENSPKDLSYSHSLNFRVSGSTKFISKQPTQLIIELNSSLWQKLGTNCIKSCTWAFMGIKSFIRRRKENIIFDKIPQFLPKWLANQISTDGPHTSATLIEVWINIQNIGEYWFK